MTLNNNIFPKGGHYFKESDGTRINGDTWAGVAKRLERYRQRKGVPPGDCLAEVVAQACAREPVICVHDNPAYNQQLRRGNLKGRVLTWLAHAQARQKDLQFVSETTRKERADICSKCPLNKELPGGCATCKAAVEESRKNVIGGRFRDGRLNACDVLGEDLQVSTHLESLAEDNGELPGHCWRKRSL